VLVPGIPVCLPVGVPGNHPSNYWEASRQQRTGGSNYPVPHAVMGVSMGVEDPTPPPHHPRGLRDMQISIKYAARRSQARSGVAMVEFDDHDASPARASMGWIHNVLRSNKHPHRSHTSASAGRSGRATHIPANRAHDSLQRDIIGIHLVACCRFTGFRFPCGPRYTADAGGWYAG
jgi:hypothetical protein